MPKNSHVNHKYQLHKYNMPGPLTPTSSTTPTITTSKSTSTTATTATAATWFSSASAKSTTSAQLPPHQQQQFLSTSTTWSRTTTTKWRTTSFTNESSTNESRRRSLPMLWVQEVPTIVLLDITIMYLFWRCTKPAIFITKLEKIDVTVTRKSGQLFKQLEERTSFIFTYLASKVHMFLFFFFVITNLYIILYIYLFFNDVYKIVPGTNV